jgi:hypothetical protein
MKDTQQSQLISSSATSTVVAVFVILASVLALVVGASV